MPTIDSTGITPKTQQSYLNDLKNKHLAIDQGWQIDPSTPDGMKMQSDSEVLAMLDEALVSIYNSLDPDSAVDQQLDRIGKLSRTPRKEATYSTSIVTFTGNAGAYVPTGTLIRHRSNGTTWRTNSPLTLADGGTGNVAVTCTTSGAISANIGTLNAIQGSIPDGVTGVTNSNAASLGQNDEDDNDYRARRYESVASGAANTIDAIYAQILSLPGVKHLRVYNNDKATVNAIGLNPHSLFVCVDGGNDTDILRAFAAVKNPGTNDNEGISTTSVEVSGDTKTPKGNPLRLSVFRPRYVSLFVKVTITSSTFSDGDKSALKQAILQYANSGYQGGTGFVKRGFQIGEEVTIGRLYTPVNAYIGDNGTVNDLIIGTRKDALSRDPVVIAFNDLAVFDAENIEIEVRTP